MAFAGLSTAASAAGTDPRACDFSRLKLGPVVELNGEDELDFDLAGGVMRIASGPLRFAYDLKRGGTVELKETRRFAAGLAKSKVASLAPMPREAAAMAKPQRLAQEPPLVLPDGRPLAVSRLYVGNYVVKVGAADGAAYERFAEALRAGEYCGAPIQKLDASRRKKLHSQVVYFLFDEISSGRIADYAAFVKYKPIFDMFLSAKEIEEFLEIYGYRSTDLDASETELAAMDPEKLWTFAWNQAAKLFNHKETAEFTDLSVFQRNGSITYMVLGTQPIEGGTLNKLGFYTKLLASAPLSSAERSQSWRWRQGSLEYSAKVSLGEPMEPVKVRPAAFPRPGRQGLIFFDATMNKADVDDLLKSYLSYYGEQGFRFGPRTPVTDAPAFLSNEIARHDLDYLIRDGHSDGDDENVFVLYPRGFLVEGRRSGPDGDEVVKLLYNVTKNPSLNRISYEQFVALLKKRGEKAETPLVFVDGSCWGLEKAWFGVGHAPASLLMEISANAPVNFFENADRNAMRRLLESIRGGHSFDQVRSALAGLSGYSGRREDWFIFPDEDLYPSNGGPLLAIEKRMWVTEPGKAPRQYIPDGYF